MDKHSHTRMSRALDYIAWGWLGAITVAVLLALVSALCWALYKAGMWLLSQDWVSLTLIGFVAFSFWCGHRIKDQRAPWESHAESCDSDKSDDGVTHD